VPSPRAPDRGGSAEQLRRQGEYLAALHETALGIIRRLDAAELLEAIIERSTALVGANSGFLYLPRPGTDEVEVKLATGYLHKHVGQRLRRGEGLAGRVWQSGEPIIVEDYQHWDGRAAPYEGEPVGPSMGIPLRSEGDVVGILGLTRAPGGPPFHPDEIDLMVRFAQLASVALDNARLVTALHQELAERRRTEAELHLSHQTLERRVAERTRELAILNSISSVVSRSLDLGAILRDALEKTTELMDMELGIAYRLGPQESEPDDPQTGGPRVLELLGQHGLSGWFVPLVRHLSIRGSMIERALPAGRPVVWRPAEYPTPAIRQAMEREGVAFGISIPLLAKGALVGALILGSRRAREVAPEELALLAGIGQQVSIAVENARLYDQARQMAAMQERNRLAQELHDSVTQSLYSITLYAEAAARILDAGEDARRETASGSRRVETGDGTPSDGTASVSAQAAEHLRELRDTAQEALREMRLLIFELKPLALQKADLAEAIRARLDAVESRVGLRSDLRVEGRASRSLPDTVKLELYHIAREALNNVLKHSGARSVTVSIDFGETAVRLEVADDGMGFDPGDAGESGGLGLSGMAEHAAGIGGRLQLHSQPGQGTRVSVEIPLKEIGI
jgi:signal transduction histidine kinase